MFISALALGPRGWIQILNFLLLGAGTFAFSRAVAAVLPEGRPSRVERWLLIVIAVAFTVSGPCVMDPTGTPPLQMTPHGIVHGLFGAVVFTLAPITCFVFWRRFRSDERWRSLAGFTLVCAIISTISVVLLRIGSPRPGAEGNALTPWSGTIQRAALIPFLLWMATFAGAILRTQGSPRRAGTTPPGGAS